MHLKVCSKCKVNKPVSDFSKNSSQKDGFQNQCKICQKSSETSRKKPTVQQAVAFIEELERVGERFTCKCCGHLKTASHFYYQRSHGRVKVSDSKCKECQKDYQRAKAFGISPDDYKDLLLSQGNSCAICKITHEEYQRTSHRGKVFAIDHDHTSGKIRGLLCDKCNRGIGFLQESEQILESAIAYLKGDDMV